MNVWLVSNIKIRKLLSRKQAKKNEVGIQQDDVQMDIQLVGKKKLSRPF